MKLKYDKPEVILEEYHSVDVLTISLGDLIPGTSTPETTTEHDLDDDDVYAPS